MRQFVVGKQCQSSNCNFQGVTVRDELLAWISKTEFQRKLPLEKKAEDIIDFTKEIPILLHQPCTQPPTPGQTTCIKKDHKTKPCSSCGGFHPQEECNFRQGTCYKCTRKGHIKRVCRTQTLAEKEFDKSLTMMSFASPTHFNPLLEKPSCVLNIPRRPISLNITFKNLKASSRFGTYCTIYWCIIGNVRLRDHLMTCQVADALVLLQEPARGVANTIIQTSVVNAAPGSPTPARDVSGQIIQTSANIFPTPRSPSPARHIMHSYSQTSMEDVPISQVSANDTPNARSLVGVHTS